MPAFWRNELAERVGEVHSRNSLAVPNAAPAAPLAVLGNGLAPAVARITRSSTTLRHVLAYDLDPLACYVAHLTCRIDGTRGGNAMTGATAATSDTNASDT